MSDQTHLGDPKWDPEQGALEDYDAEGEGGTKGEQNCSSPSGGGEC